MMRKLKKLIRTAPILRELNLILHRGDIYTCPFCNYCSKDLFVLGGDSAILEQRQIVGGGKRNAGCYKCNSDDRERLVYVYLKEKLDFFNREKSVKILHIAPEGNLADKFLACGFTEYICGDLLTPGYRYGAHVQNMNILNIPFAANYFDLIICNHVFEHIPDDLRAMREVNRVLKKRGEAILQVPISTNAYATVEDFSITEPEARELAFGQRDHVRIYGQDYIDRLAKCGFEVKRVNISREFSRFGLNSDEDIFVGTK
jgi:SAM-dependent methyltransferase